MGEGGVGQKLIYNFSYQQWTNVISGQPLIVKPISLTWCIYFMYCEFRPRNTGVGGESHHTLSNIAMTQYNAAGRFRSPNLEFFGIFEACENHSKMA